MIGLLVGMQPYYLQHSALSTPVAWTFLSTFGTGGFSMLGASLVFGSVLFSRPIQQALDHHVLRYVGSVSYAMYAMHFLLLGSFTSWLYLNVVDGLGHFGATICSIAITIPVLALLSHVVTNTVDRRSHALSNWFANKCLPDGRLQFVMITQARHQQMTEFMRKNRNIRQKTASVPSESTSAS